MHFSTETTLPIRSGEIIFLFLGVLQAKCTSVCHFQADVYFTMKITI